MGPQVKCSTCNTPIELEKKLQFCPHCGNELPQPCPDCGVMVERLSEGCSNCGGEKEKDSGKTIMVWGGPPDPDPPDEETEDTDPGSPLPSVIVDMGEEAPQDETEEEEDELAPGTVPQPPTPYWMEPPEEDEESLEGQTGFDDDDEYDEKKWVKNPLQTVVVIAIFLLLIALCGAWIVLRMFSQDTGGAVSSAQQPTIAANPPTKTPPTPQKGVSQPLPATPVPASPSPEPQPVPTPTSTDGGVEDGWPANQDDGGVVEEDAGEQAQNPSPEEESFPSQILGSSRYSFPVTAIQIGEETIWWQSSRYRCVLNFNAYGHGELLEAVVDTEEPGWMHVEILYDRYLFLNTCEEGEVERIVARIPAGYTEHHGQPVVQGPGEIRAYQFHYVAPPAAEE